MDRGRGLVGSKVKQTGSTVVGNGVDREFQGIHYTTLIGPKAHEFIHPQEKVRNFIPRLLSEDADSNLTIYYGRRTVQLERTAETTVLSLFSRVCLNIPVAVSCVFSLK